MSAINTFLLNEIDEIDNAIERATTREEFLNSINDEVEAFMWVSGADRDIAEQFLIDQYVEKQKNYNEIDNAYIEDYVNSISFSNQPTELEEEIMSETGYDRDFAKELIEEEQQPDLYMYDEPVEEKIKRKEQQPDDIFDEPFDVYYEENDEYNEDGDSIYDFDPVDHYEGLKDAEINYHLDSEFYSVFKRNVKELYKFMDKPSQIGVAELYEKLINEQRLKVADENVSATIKGKRRKTKMNLIISFTDPGDEIEGIKKIEIIKYIKRVFKMDPYEVKITTRIQFDVPRVSVQGNKLKGMNVNLNEIKNLLNGKQMYYVSGSGPTEGEEVPIIPDFKRWKIAAFIKNGGKFNKTKFKGKFDRIRKKFSYKNLEEKGFYLKGARNVHKYKIINSKYNDVIVLSYDRANNTNCFYHSLKMFFKNRKVVDKFKKEIKPYTLLKLLNKKKGDFISLKDVIKVEKIIGKPINVFDRNLNELISPKRKTNINLILEDQHFLSLFPKLKKTEKKKYYKEKKDDSIVLAFDFETVKDEDGVCLVYSYSAVGETIDGKIKIPIFNYIGENALIHFYKKVMKIYNTYKRKITLLSYNGDRFDNIILVEELFKHNYKLNLSYEGNKVTNIENFCIAGTVDLCRILTGTLAGNCKNYNLSKKVSKSTFDHSDAQRVYDKDGIQGIINKYKDELLKYNDLDVISLFELFKISSKMFIEIAELLNVKINKDILLRKRTTASLTKCLCNLHSKKHGYENPGLVPNSYKMFKEGRKSLYGGRSQMFKDTSRIVKDYSSIDWVSLYPSVMCNNTLDSVTGKKISHMYPTGKVIEVNKLIEINRQDLHPLLKYKLGIYDVTMLNQEAIKFNLIPKRTEKDGLDWTNKMIEELKLTTIDIAHLEKLNCTFKVGKGIVWESMSNDYFNEYISKIYLIKQQEDKYSNKSNKDHHLYNPAKRQTIKILLNSLFGKNCENVHDDYFKIGDIFSDINEANTKLTDIIVVGDKIVVKGKREEKYFEENWKKLHKNHSLTGAFILSYTRYFMYHFIRKYEDTIMYTDTDSIHIPYKESLKMLEEYPWLKINNVKKLGQVENEFEKYHIEKSNVCVYLGKKMYCICDENRVAKKYKLKGVSIKLNKEGYGYFNRDNKFTPFKENNIYDFYKQLLDNKKIDVTTTQFRKNAMLCYETIDKETSEIKDECVPGAIRIIPLRKTIKLKC